MKRFFVLTLNTKTFINEWVNTTAPTAQQAAEQLTDNERRVITVYEAKFIDEKIDFMKLYPLMKS